MKSQQHIKWTRLDNAAKIFPCTTTAKDVKVFRIACELYENVEQDILSVALERTVESFPFYKSAIKKGLFWYYFEANDFCPAVHIENRPPCSPLYTGDKKGSLFDVSYYKKRINLEVYHALTDGAGALFFLKTLVFNYITIKYKSRFKTLPPLDYDASEYQRQNDSFFKYYSGGKLSVRPMTPKAYRIKGERLDNNRLGVIEGLFSTNSIVSLAREKGVTVTALLIAALICAIHEEMPLRAEGRDVAIDVPVNLRKYFKSETARNFFALVNVSYNFKNNDKSFDAVLAYVAESLKTQLTEEHLRYKLNKLSAIENFGAAKIVPLAIKNPCMKLASDIVERSVTAAFSNIGKISLPEEFAEYVRLFDVFTSTARLQICTCSYMDNFMISFSSGFSDTDIQRNFFRTLTSFGLETEISTNIFPADRHKGADTDVL